MLRAEAVSWNQWGADGRPLLFNDRVALLVELDVRTEGEARWVPERTVLEVNRPENAIGPAPTAEHLLAELQWHALQQEKMLLDGDLVQRTRHAGAFRDAWLSTDGSDLSGVVAFPREGDQQAVGALRLTLGLTVDGAPETLEWVFR